MREIKFRAWCESGMVNDLSLHDTMPEDWEVFLQYTGLKDKNGVEIYEGDVVKVDAFNPPIYEVTFDRGGFCLKQNDQSGYYPDIKYAEDEYSEVIGNIYQNPELLRK